MRALLQTLSKSCHEKTAAKSTFVSLARRNAARGEGLAVIRLQEEVGYLGCSAGYLQCFLSKEWSGYMGIEGAQLAYLAPLHLLRSGPLGDFQTFLTNSSKRLILRRSMI